MCTSFNTVQSFQQNAICIASNKYKPNANNMVPTNAEYPIQAPKLKYPIHPIYVISSHSQSWLSHWSVLFRHWGWLKHLRCCYYCCCRRLQRNWRRNCHHHLRLPSWWLGNDVWMKNNEGSHHQNCYYCWGWLAECDGYEFELGIVEDDYDRMDEVWMPMLGWLWLIGGGASWLSMMLYRSAFSQVQRQRCNFDCCSW